MAIVVLVGALVGGALVVRSRHDDDGKADGKDGSSTPTAADLEHLRLASGALPERTLRTDDLEHLIPLDLNAEWVLAEDAREPTAVVPCLPGLATQTGGWLRHWGLADDAGRGLYGQAMARVGTYADADAARAQVVARSADTYQACYLKALEADLTTESGGAQVQPAKVSSKQAGTNDDGAWIEYRTYETYLPGGSPCVHTITHRWQQVGAELVETSFESCGADFGIERIASLNSTLLHRVDGSRDPDLAPEGLVPPPADPRVWDGMDLQEQIHHFLALQRGGDELARAAQRVVWVPDEGVLDVHLSPMAKSSAESICSAVSRFMYGDPANASVKLHFYRDSGDHPDGVRIMEREGKASSCQRIAE
jgi:hypothetical protein